MHTNSQNQKQSFLAPYSRYYGPFTPKNLTFNANLQEFANQVGIICNLETGGKISSEEAYQQILGLWQELSNSRDNLIDDED